MKSCGLVKLFEIRSVENRIDFDEEVEIRVDQVMWDV